VRTREEAARILEIENATVTDSAVSGDVVNRSRNTVRDVQLLVRHIWLWDRETKPGTNDPSTSAYYKLEKDIPPGSRVPFTYQPAIALPKMASGHFVTTVAIGGFAELILQPR
jgi:hypothetical protein